MDFDDDAQATPARSESLDQVAKFIDQVIGLMHQGGISELELEHGNFRLSLLSDGVQQPNVSPTMSTSQTSGSAAPRLGESSDDSYTITAPMIGTYYAAPAPGEKPFVQPGDQIEEGQTVGIIEAMKIMNEIAADVSGEVVEIVAENGQTVEYGSPLVVVRPTT